MCFQMAFPNIQSNCFFCYVLKIMEIRLDLWYIILKKHLKKSMGDKIDKKKNTNMEVKKKNRNDVFRYICRNGMVSNPDISYD